MVELVLAAEEGMPPAVGALCILIAGALGAWILYFGIKNQR